MPAPVLESVVRINGCILIAVALGRGRADIIVMMGEQGIFHVLTMMLMYNPTSEVTAGCLARLAGTCDPAGREAQVHVSGTHQDPALTTVLYTLHSNACTFTLDTFSYSASNRPEVLLLTLHFDGLA